MKVGREEVKKNKNGAEPKQLGREGRVRTAAVDACNLGIVIDEPIQSWIQGGWIAYDRGAQKTEVAKEFI